MAQTNSVRNASQDALNESEFERLVEATDQLPTPRDAEAMFILMVGGRLGMRAGEISHMQESWVNWNRKMIEVPAHSDCWCGYCSKMAKQQLEYDPSLSYDEQLEKRWTPKTPQSIRSIPFDFSDRIEATVRQFFATRDEYEHSRVSINRRVTEVAEAAGLDPVHVYPHCLRATAATWNSYKGLAAPALQSLFGWSSISTSMKYIRLSGGATADALQEAHADE